MHMLPGQVQEMTFQYLMLIGVNPSDVVEVLVRPDVIRVARYKTDHTHNQTCRPYAKGCVVFEELRPQEVATDEDASTTAVD